MNLDALPFDVLLVASAIVWAAYFLLLTLERKRNRSHDADARVTRERVLPQRMQHGVPDDEVEGEQPNRSADDPADDESERVSSHARSIPRGPVVLPPGIPSILERLDRWT